MGMHRRTGIAAAVALAIALTACGGEPPQDGGGDQYVPPPESTYYEPPPPETTYYEPPSPTPDPVEAGPYTHTTSQQVCDDVGATRALTVETTDPELQKYLAEWDLCADLVRNADGTPGVRTWIRNNSDAVWVLPQTSWNDVRGQWAAEALKQYILVEAVTEAGADATSPAFITPGEAMLIDRPPAEVRWELEMDLTYTWMISGEMIGKLTSTGESVSIQVAKSRGTAPAAVVTCAVSFYHFARSASGLEQMETKQVLEAGFQTVADTNACATAAHDARVQKTGATVMDTVVAPLPKSLAVVQRLDTVAQRYKGPIMKLADAAEFFFKIR
jgi:hypothetical protein